MFGSSFSGPFLLVKRDCLFAASIFGEHSAQPSARDWGQLGPFNGFAYQPVWFKA